MQDDTEIEKTMIALQQQVALPGFEKLNPQHVTFRGGYNEPLHGWFPYLEGYSPDFVRHMLNTYMPQAQRIIDPFAGSGTTPFVLSTLSIHCGYCEVNPVMQQVVKAKIWVASLVSEDRAVVAEQLNTLSFQLSKMLRSTPKDEQLLLTYRATFGSSEFFDETVLDDILRLRHLNDRLSQESELVGILFSVAVTSQLVTCSRLKRAGDVRFKTPKEMLNIPPLLPSISNQLRQMAIDCVDCQIATMGPTFLTANAKQLSEIPSFQADGVITSPPYLNGTNYFRNTKIELWYIRELSTNDDLRLFRDEAITSGINDVAGNKGKEGIPAPVVGVVNELEKSAYDQRIPRMVAGYFYDMQIVLRGLAHHTVPNAIVCIDIGDSKYGGVVVPTPDLLIEIAESCGFELQDRVNLRSRISKDRSQLSQDLIVFKRVIQPHAQITTSQYEKIGLAKWESFKENLPHQQPPFNKRNWGNGLHSICSYQGKMKPSLAFHLVDAFTRPGDVILDPFSGSGSIPFEAALHGRRAYGLDISLLSTSVSNAKLNLVDHTKIEQLLQQLEEWIRSNPPSETEIEEATTFGFNGTISDYFHPQTLLELLSARNYFMANTQHTSEWYFVFACLLHVLHGNRPYALSRNSHPITPFAPTGPTIYKSVIDKVRDKVERSFGVKAATQFTPGKCFQADILSDWPAELSEIDAIITSPPFFDSTRFYMTNWMRFWLAGWSRSDFDTVSEQFVEKKQKQSLEIYKTIFQRFHERLKQGGIAVLHLGVSKKCDMAAELSRFASDKFEIVDVFNESVEHCESHGVRDKGTVTGHQYLMLRKY